MSRRRVGARLAIAALPALLSMPPTAPPASAAAPVITPATTQVVLVVVPGWEATGGSLSAFERDAAGPWRRRGASHPVTIGRHGSAWGLGLHPPPADGPRKREGDGRSPAGVFAIGPAFGAAPNCDTGLDYRPLTGDDWCIDVPDSPHYNRIVDAREVGAAAVAGSTEPMRRDLHRGDDAYALGFVIGHNAACERGAGSCIFAHLAGTPPRPTAGCTAMTAGQMQALLGWLRREAEPRFVLLPAGVAEAKAAAWGLPRPQESGGP
jgi:L,D-peptidoglycan transpeptidase YkuD (ErfK/YbiS/YcfS/YnhG family)